MIRKLLLTTAILLIVVASGTAQDVSARYQGQIIGSRGLPLANQFIAVCNQPATTTTQPCSPLATLGTSTSTTSGGANPVQSDNIGNFFFYAPAGKYTLQIYGPKVGTQLVTPDILIGQSLVGGLTSVGLALPVQFVVSGSPVTTSGTLTGTWQNVPANYVLGGPTPNSIGGIYDGFTGTTGTSTTPSATRTPTTAKDWAFVAVMPASTSQTNPPTMPGGWTRNYTNGSGPAVFNQVFSTSAPITGTVTLDTSATWAELLILLRAGGGSPAIGQQAFNSGAFGASFPATFGSNTTNGNSVLAIVCGVPPNAGAGSGRFSDTSLNAYTQVGYIQNGGAEICIAGMSATITGGVTPTVTFTNTGGGTYTNVFLLIMELTNLSPATGEPVFEPIVSSMVPPKASGVAVMTTALIGAGACGGTVTVAAPSTVTTDTISWAFNLAPAANPAQLVVSAWPTANNVNFQYCNPTAAGITPNAATLNWRVPL